MLQNIVKLPVNLTALERNSSSGDGCKIISWVFKSGSRSTATETASDPDWYMLLFPLDASEHVSSGCEGLSAFEHRTNIVHDKRKCLSEVSVVAYTEKDFL